MDKEKKYRIKEYANNINDIGNGGLIVSTISTALLVSHSSIPNGIAACLGGGICMCVLYSGLLLTVGTVFDAIYEHVDKKEKKLLLNK